MTTVKVFERGLAFFCCFKDATDGIQQVAPQQSSFIGATDRGMLNPEQDHRVELRHELRTRKKSQVLLRVGKFLLSFSVAASMTRRSPRGSKPPFALPGFRDQSLHILTYSGVQRSFFDHFSTIWGNYLDCTLFITNAICERTEQKMLEITSFFLFCATLVSQCSTA